MSTTARDKTPTPAPVRVTDASVRECVMYANLDLRGEATDQIGTTAEIIHGDALEYLKSIPNDSIQLVVSSPPYNVGKEYEERLSAEQYIEWQTQIICELVRVTKAGGSICWQVGNSIDRGEIIPLDAIFYPVFKSEGLKLRNRIVWTFGHGLHARRRFSGRHETILWFTKGDDYYFDLDSVRVPVKYPNKKHFKGPRRGELSSNPAGKNPGDVWDIPNVKANHLEKTAHPCQFPIGLVERLILALTKPGDEVLDPFLGSGSTVLAAVKNGRKGAGVDSSEEYIAIANERLALLRKGKLRTRPMNKPVFEPGTNE